MLMLGLGCHVIFPLLGVPFACLVVGIKEREGWSPRGVVVSSHIIKKWVLRVLGSSEGLQLR